MSVDLRIVFPGGMRVSAEFGSFAVETDQPVGGGGEAAAPTPFDHFVASIGTCVGYYALKFLRQRELPTEGFELTLSTVEDPERHMIAEIVIKMVLPADFPERYRAAIVRAVDQCAVKKHLTDPPRFTTIVEQGDARPDPVVGAG